MTIYLKIYAVLIVLAATLSCNGQQKTSPKKTNNTPAEVTTVTPEDYDPYFIETQTVSSDYGPKSITRNILQDKKGNIWFATWEGILKYDGKTFTNLTNEENLKRFHVFSLFEDSVGNIWFGTIGAGVYRYDDQTFTNFTTKDGLAHDSIGCFFEDKKGILWIGTMNGLTSYDGKSFTNYSTEDGLTNGDINSIVADASGKLWIGTRGEAALYDGKTFSKLSTPKGKTFVNVRTIIKDKDGKMWFGGNDGLWRYTNKTFTNYSERFTGYIYQDNSENIWTSSETDIKNHDWELKKYDKIAQQNKGTTAQRIKAEKNMFFGITEDTNGGIWFGHLRGVYRFDGLLFNDFNLPQIRQ